MKLPLGALLLWWFATSNSLTTLDQKCDINQDVYENKSSQTMVVTMQFIDHCKGADSMVYVYDENSHKTGLTVTVPDGQTKSFTLEVPAGQTIRFNYRGEGKPEGGCSSELVSAFLKP